MTEIVIQADLGGLSIAFTDPAKGTDEASLNERLDLYTKVIGRQRAKFTLSEKLVDLLAARKALAALPEQEREVLKSRAEERARQHAAMAAAHDVAGKRGEFMPNLAQRNQLSAFDAETAAEREKLQKQRQTLERDIPIIEAQISRLRAVIAGGDPIDPLVEESESLAKEKAAVAA